MRIIINIKIFRLRYLHSSVRTIRSKVKNILLRLSVLVEVKRVLTQQVQKVVILKLDGTDLLCVAEPAWLRQTVQICLDLHAILLYRLITFRFHRRGQDPSKPVSVCSVSQLNRNLYILENMWEKP